MISVRDVDIKNKRVFLRVDFNVPIENGKIVDNNRIKAALPTIQYLIENHAKIIIGTHIGRPEGKFNKEFSTILVANELSNLLNKEVFVSDHIIDPVVAKKIYDLKPCEIIVLGNLRFSSAEENNDDSFAKELASYGEIYVNDAFAVSHRANASVAAITKFLPSYAGLLLESEITKLGLLLDNPEHPFVLVIGGAKISDKASLVENLAQKADKVLVGGAVASTFLAAKGENVSRSLIDTEMLNKCRDILRIFKDKIVLPIDFVKSDLGGGEFSNMDIGAKTRELFVREIIEAKSVFWNGNLGYTEDERFIDGTKAIALAISQNPNTTVIAGGDTAGFVNTNKLGDNISFISTGGGAAMEYLAGEELPGIKALDKA